MPWKVGLHKDCPVTKPHAVLNKETGKLHGCHASKDAAAAQIAALYANERSTTDNRGMEPNQTRLRSRDLARAVVGDEGRVGLNAEEGIMFGQFASFGEWTEINNRMEGHFMERIAPGAAEKTIRERGRSLPVLFHHGLDPFFGHSVLGAIRSLEPDTTFEVELFKEADYVQRLIPGLRANVYGVSWLFDVVQEDANFSPGRSEHNPQGLPETTVLEMKVREFGPTPTPHYKGGKAALRSITDEVALGRLLGEDIFAAPEGLRQLVERAAALQEDSEKPDESTSLVQEPQHSAEPTTREEDKPSWLLE